MATKKRTRGKLVKDLDAVYSRYIRFRDSQLQGTPGKARCVTCIKQYPIKAIQCGHFITRGCYPLRWDEKNTHAQCKGCNIFRSGEQALHRDAIVRMYGEDEAVRLLDTYVQWKNGKGTKITTQEVQEMLNHYTYQVEKLDTTGLFK